MKQVSGILFSFFSLVMLAAGWGGWYILKNVYPELSFAWYPFVPLVFLILGFIDILVLANCNKENPRKLVNIYMLLKLSKILVAAIFILAYHFVVKENMKIFLLTFAAFYAIGLGFETYASYITEKKQRLSK